MEIVGIGLWIIAAVITVSWAYGVRAYVRSGKGVSNQTVNQTMLFAVSLLIVPLFRISPLHLLWMFPAGFVLGGLSIALPFSMLSIPGRVFGRICCIGLVRNEERDNGEKSVWPQFMDRTNDKATLREKAFGTRSHSNFT